MKKIFILLYLFLFFINPSFAELSNVDYTVFEDNKHFGLKDIDDNITVKAQYTKLIRLGTSSWIIQKKGKYGIIDSCGNVLVEPKYRRADRLFGKYLKLGNDLKYGIFDEKGEVLIPMEYSSIDMLFGGMFLTCKDFKYGIIDNKGNVILENKFDNIYMPKPYIMRIQYNGKWYEIQHKRGEEFTLPKDITSLQDDNNFTITDFVSEPIAASGYSAVTLTDYILKIFSSISPAHEATIDEILFSQGADTVSILKRMSWIPRYPFTFAKKYYYDFRTPNNGPLNDYKDTLKVKIKEEN